MQIAAVDAICTVCSLENAAVLIPRQLCADGCAYPFSSEQLMYDQRSICKFISYIANLVLHTMPATVNAQSFARSVFPSLAYSERVAHRPRMPATSGPRTLIPFLPFHCLSIFCTFVLSYSSALKGESSKGSNSSAGVKTGSVDWGTPSSPEPPLPGLCSSVGFVSGCNRSGI